MDQPGTSSRITRSRKDQETEDRLVPRGSTGLQSEDDRNSAKVLDALGTVIKKKNDPKIEGEANGQVPYNYAFMSNNNIDNLSCHSHKSGFLRTANVIKDEYFDLRSVSSRMRDINLTAQIELEEESARLELEAKLMRKRAEIMERRSQLLKESSLEHGLPIDENEQLGVNDSRDRMDRFISDCKQNAHNIPSVNPDKPGEKDLISDKIDPVVHGNNRLDLPKIELPKFGGNTNEYWSFIRQFETHVESRTTNPSQRLLYLMYYCYGEAKEAIAGCSILSADEGYTEARTLLKRLFGRGHVVSRHLIDEVLSFPRIQKYDDKALTRLYVKMITCWKTLNQMNYLADINSVGTIQRIVDKLPEDMVDRWIRESYKVYEAGREPEFMDLVKFIDREAAIAQTRYADSKKTQERPNRQKIEYKAVDRWTHGAHRVVNHIDKIASPKEEPKRCLFCDKNHKVSQCEQYIGMSTDKRWELVKLKGGCFSCLSTGHAVKDCRNRRQCGVDGCERRHHASLHVKLIVDNKNSKVFTSLRDSEQEVSLGILPIRLVGPKGQETIYALLDTGSNTTLIKKDLVNKVGVVGTKAEITVNTVTGESKMAVRKCDFIVTDLNQNDEVNIVNAFAVDDLPLKLRAKSLAEVVRRWPHLAGIPDNGLGDGLVTMIIGCDQPKAHWVSELKNGSESQPFGVRTPLGWVVLGPVQREAQLRSIVCTTSTESQELEQLEKLIGRLYNNEFEDLGCNERELSRVEREAVDIVTDGTTKDDDKYIVPLPWIRYPPQLVNNKHYALKRLVGLKKRFHSYPGLSKRYNEIFEDQIRKGYIEEMKSSSDIDDSNAWYLPHHPVFNPRKPDKLRIVFDCAAKYLGRSINDCLHQGPDTIANLVGVLLRFRRLPVGIMADIEEMFLQVKLPVKDRDWMRFLWWKDGNTEGTIEEFRMLVHPFGARSSPFCANYALKQTVRDNEATVSKGTIAIANRDIYVDDCIASVEDSEAAKLVISELTDIMRSGGFRLRKWLSNNREALLDVPKEELAKEVQPLLNEELPVERALGVEWSAEEDQLRFKFNDSDKPNTRRGVLSTIASVFDPLGLISPIILKAKILLQSMCKAKLEWDQQLGKEDLQLWLEWKAQMTQLELIQFPRCVRHSEVPIGSMQLHLFADASELGYGAVAYVRTNEDGVYGSRILMSKARVAPLKTVSIPRLELSAAVLAVRIYRTIVREFGETFESVHFWIDSTIVLRYLYNTTSRFATFVANRVQEILESTTVSQWRHIQSELNPADYASRGLLVNDPKLKVWMNGPSFLSRNRDEWPNHVVLSSDNDNLETKGVVLHLDRLPTQAMDRILLYYSTWNKMVKAVVWWCRFKRYLSVMAGREGSVSLGKLKVEELDAAEIDILRYVQRTTFPEEYSEVLKENKHISGFTWQSNRLRKLCPKVRNGLMVVSGRCSLAAMGEASKYPIILPSNHPVTTAIILSYHEREGHSGVSHTLAKIRERMWVLNGGATVRRILRKCLICRRMNATSLKQRMADLPIERVQVGWYPFQYVGMDFFGPFQVRRGRLLEKRYGCIFTCLQCRAIHLELAQTLSTDSFILALMRFINRRGIPKEIHSDNGGNFIGAERELREWLVRLEQDKIIDAMTTRRITWKFNPPLASHRGGIWERMIRSVRKILNSVAGRGSLDEELLWTYLTQAERIINDRPLTAVREGQEEPVPIRASDLLQPKGKDFIAINLPLSQMVEKRWRIVNNLTAEFWNRWKGEYLSSLQERQKWTTEYREPKVGDLVITEVESTPRTYWPLGIVEEALTDTDGKIRTVLVRTSSGLIKRDIRKVYLLEGVG